MGGVAEVWGAARCVPVCPVLYRPRQAEAASSASSPPASGPAPWYTVCHGPWTECYVIHRMFWHSALAITLRLSIGVHNFLFPSCLFSLKESNIA